MVLVEFVEHRRAVGLHVGAVAVGAGDGCVGAVRVAGAVGCGGPLGVEVQGGEHAGRDGWNGSVELV